MVAVSVVTICREPRAVVMRLIEWHRRLGVTHFRIYLDNPDDPIFPDLSTMADVTAIRCDADFWQTLGLTPESAWNFRQVGALTHGYRAVTEGWVAVFDADELFWFNGRSFQEVLAQIAAEDDFIRVRTAERLATPALDPQTVHFRLPLTKPQSNVVYGEDAVLFRPSEGLIGHAPGKSITRAGRAINCMRPHWPVARRQPLRGRLMSAADGTYLLHLINEDFAHWCAKIPRRIAHGGVSPRVGRELARVWSLPEAERPEALVGTYHRLFAADGQKIGRLQMVGGYLALPADLFALGGAKDGA